MTGRIERNTCEICGCAIHTGGKDYGQDSKEGRSHASKHHCVAERFFGRTKSGRTHIFNQTDPWELESQKSVTLCYDCHEELLHNPVFLAADIEQFAKLVKLMKLKDKEKPAAKDRLAKRIVLLHEVIEKGLKAMLRAEESQRRVG